MYGLTFEKVGITHTMSLVNPAAGEGADDLLTKLYKTETADNEESPMWIATLDELRFHDLASVADDLVAAGATCLLVIDDAN